MTLLDDGYIVSKSQRSCRFRWSFRENSRKINFDWAYYVTLKGIRVDFEIWVIRLYSKASVKSFATFNAATCWKVVHFFSLRVFLIDFRFVSIELVPKFKNSMKLSFIYMNERFEITFRLSKKKILCHLAYIWMNKFFFHVVSLNFETTYVFYLFIQLTYKFLNIQPN